MIPKPNKPPTKPSSYRPISLLNTMSKLFEAIIHIRLKKFLHENEIVCPEQTGFRHKTATTHQILRLTEAITSGFNSKMISHAVFLDLEAAFDRVWTLGLIHKLQSLEIPLYLVKIIQSFATERTFSVQVNSSSSFFRPISSGVPQGAILSPTLFNLFVNDTPTSPSTHLYLYADDTTILSQSSNPEFAADKLQDHLDNYEDWAKLWKLSVNASKCTHIVFSKRPKAGEGPSLFFGENRIPKQQIVKYLGVHMDKKLTWSHHIKTQIRKAKGVRTSLLPLIKASSPLSIKTKLLLYKSTIKPLLSYASPVWLHAAASHLKRLQTTENVIIRKIVGAPWYISNRNLRKDLNITPLLHCLKSELHKFAKSLPLTNNKLISHLWDYNLPAKPKHKVPKTAFLPTHIPSP